MADPKEAKGPVVTNVSEATRVLPGGREIHPGKSLALLAEEVEHEVVKLWLEAGALLDVNQHAKDVQAAAKATAKDAQAEAEQRAADDAAKAESDKQAAEKAAEEAAQAEAERKAAEEAAKSGAAAQDGGQTAQ